MEYTLSKSGRTAPGNAAVALEKNKTVAILQEVPAEVCENCGEHYLSEQTTTQVLEEAQVAAIER